MRWRLFALLSFFCVVAGVLAAPQANATTTHVSCDTTDLLTKLAAANANADRDVLSLAPRCTYLFTSGSASNALSINHDLTIIGNNALLLRNARTQFRILFVFPSVNATISHLTIAGGQAPDGTTPGPSTGAAGGGIENEGTLTLKSVVVTGNVAGGGQSDAGGTAGGTGGAGGGIMNIGTLTIVSSRITANRAGDASGSINTGVAGGSGGGIKNDGTLHLIRTKISGNRAGAGGFSVGTGGAGGSGGGLDNNALGTMVTIVRSSIVDNAAGAAGNGAPPGPQGTGGGVRNLGSTIFPARTVIARNTPDNCAPSGSVNHCTS